MGLNIWYREDPYFELYRDDNDILGDDYYAAAEYDGMEYEDDADADDDNKHTEL